MTQETTQITEEAPGTEETPRTEERAAPPKRLPIQPPTPFDEAGLGPFLDIWMKRRGITDRSMASSLLGTVFGRIGYDPRKDIENVSLYIDNLSSIIDSIPDTPETLPVKGALLARGATEVTGMLSTSHFGGKRGEMDDLKEIMNYGMKIQAAFKALDSAYGGGNTPQESETIKELKGRIDRMEKKSEFEAALAPIRLQLSSLGDQIKELDKKPGTPEESTALKEVRESIDKVNARFEKKEEQDRFTAEMQGIRADLKSYQESLGKSGGQPGDVSNVFDQATSLMDKIIELQKKYGGGGEGEIDWKVASITTVGEVATEAINAAREIMSGQEGTEETLEETKKEPISQRIIDKKVLDYVRKRAAAGATDISTLDAAKALKLNQKQVFDSYQRLAKKGLITTPGAETKETESKGVKIDSSKWVEGD